MSTSRRVWLTPVQWWTGVGLALGIGFALGLIVGVWS